MIYRNMEKIKAFLLTIGAMTRDCHGDCLRVAICTWMAFPEVMLLYNNNCFAILIGQTLLSVEGKEITDDALYESLHMYGYTYFLNAYKEVCTEFELGVLGEYMRATNPTINL